jgi:hypothetical protein
LWYKTFHVIRSSPKQKKIIPHETKKPKVPVVQIPYVAQTFAYVTQVARVTRIAQLFARNDVLFALYEK